MEVVASHLATHTLIVDDADKDCFGRSVFNRYYYSIYLELRAGLSKLDPAWNTPKHKRVITILNTDIVNSLTRGRKIAIKHADTELQTICDEGISAAKTLANLFERGLGVRTVADYKPEIQVDFSVHGQFALNDISVEEAKEWAAKARALMYSISSAWTQVNA